MECVGKKMDTQKYSKFCISEDRNFKKNYKTWLEEENIPDKIDLTASAVVIDHNGDDGENSIEVTQKNAPPSKKQDNERSALPELEFKKTQIATVEEPSLKQSSNADNPVSQAQVVQGIKQPTETQEKLGDGDDDSF